MKFNAWVCASAKSFIFFRSLPLLQINQHDRSRRSSKNAFAIAGVRNVLARRIRSFVTWNPPLPPPQNSIWQGYRETTSGAELGA